MCLFYVLKKFSTLSATIETFWHGLHGKLLEHFKKHFQMHVEQFMHSTQTNKLHIRHLDVAFK